LGKAIEPAARAFVLICCSDSEAKSASENSPRRSAKAIAASKTVNTMATTDSVSVFAEGTFEDQVRIFFSCVSLCLSGAA